MDFDFWPTEEPLENYDMTRSNKQFQSKGIDQDHEETEGGHPAKKGQNKTPASKQLRASRNRGRPRLDPKDDNPTERRRKQIRLAQRAYRQRKETTISSLNGRVTDLERTIEEMNQVFLKFYEKLTPADFQCLSPAASRELRETVTGLSTLARKSREAWDIEDADVSHQEPLENNERPAYSFGIEGPAHGDLGRQNIQGYQQASAFNQAQDSMLSAGFATTYAANSDSVEQSIAAKNPDGSSLVTLDPTNMSSELLPQNRNDLNVIQNPSALSGGLESQDPNQYPASWRYLEQFRVEFPDPVSQMQNLFPPPERPLPPPWTFSFQESTFARRLLRRAYEYMLKILTTPGANEDLHRICKLSLRWTKRENVTKHFRNMVSTSTTDSLEYWGAPQLHIGDAGLHYPRDSLDKNCPPPPSGWENRAPMGPWPPFDPEIRKGPSQTIEQIVEQIGFGGDWFDPNDVEHYLRTKGIHLDGNSSVVEVKNIEEVPFISSPNTSSTISSDGPSSPRFDQPLISENEMLPAHGEAFWDGSMKYPVMGLPTLDLPFADMGVERSTNNFSVDMGATAGFSGSLYSKVPPIRKVVDVEKFIECKYVFLRWTHDVRLNFDIAILPSASCLGRVPGFRLNAIDSALASSIQEVS
ncbi:MAG: hypothetical protein Q9167_004707 [Letrouitia subvulpina]